MSPALTGSSPALPGDSRLDVEAHGFSQVPPMFSPVLRGVPKAIKITPVVLMYQSSEITASVKAVTNTLLRSNTLLIQRI